MTIKAVLIRKWLNKIEKFGPRWKFLGDGHGEFEKIAPTVTLKVLHEYIEICQEQIALAHEVIEVFSNE